MNYIKKNYLFKPLYFQMYDQIATAEIVLMNTGLVGYEFTAVGMDPGMAERPKAGVPIMIPHTVSPVPAWVTANLNIPIDFIHAKFFAEIKRIQLNFY